MTAWIESIDDNILVFIWWIILFILIFPLLMLIFYTSMLWIKRIKKIPGYILVSSTKKVTKKRIETIIKIFMVLVLIHSIIAYFLFLNPFVISIRREYLIKTFKNWEIVKFEDKSFAVVGKKGGFVTLFEVEEKEDTLIINKNELIGVLPQYITDRKYKTFKNIVVVYI